MAISSPPAPSSQSSALVDLFSKSGHKPSPGYDYSVVPSRLVEDRDSEEEGEEDGGKKKEKKKKPKSGLRGLRKKAAAEAAAAASGVSPADHLADRESAVVEKVEKAKTDKQKEAIEVQKHDRMAQVKHEDSKERVVDPESEERTVYVGNLPLAYRKQDLKKLFSVHGRIETVRFRCAARPDMKTTKKVAVIKQKYHEERSSIAAYVRFVEKAHAVSATVLNGTELDGHAIRVDLALAAKSHDNKRAVFLGNLDFKVQENEIRALFRKCGEVESVRLVRDSATGIGKGFGYVNFASEESVELALRLINQEVAGRKVRVTRAVRKAKPGKLIESNTAKKGRKQEGKLKKGETKPKTSTDKREAKPKTSIKSQGGNKRVKNFRKVKEEAKSFQGVSTSTEKPKKFKSNKTQKKNKIMAEKLAA